MQARIDPAFCKRVNSIDVIARLNKQLFGDDLEARSKFKVGYEPKSQRVTLRHGKVRLVIQ
jgi:hypothetical protein